MMPVSCGEDAGERPIAVVSDEGPVSWEQFRQPFFSPPRLTSVASRYRYVMQDSLILLLDVSVKQDSHH